MQLDHNRIAIRERDSLDVLDLALRVIRAHAGPLAVAFACGVLPAVCFNAWLLGEVHQISLVTGNPMSYLWSMFLLVGIEAPLVTAPMTLYLGEALFTERPRPGEIARRFLGSLPQLTYYQMFLRSLAIVVFFSWIWLAGSSGAFLAVISIALLLIWAIFSAFSCPYLGEVILLERNPFRAKSPGRMTTNRRRRLLCAGFRENLFLRWLVSLGVGLLLFASFWGSLWLTGGLLMNEWDATMGPATVGFPLAIWLVVGYLAVVRFLGYLDLRIRREGWEVELMIRAEQARLKRQLA